MKVSPLLVSTAVLLFAGPGVLARRGVVGDSSNLSLGAEEEEPPIYKLLRAGGSARPAAQAHANANNNDTGSNVMAGGPLKDSIQALSESVHSVVKTMEADGTPQLQEGQMDKLFQELDNIKIVLTHDSLSLAEASTREKILAVKDLALTFETLGQLTAIMDASLEARKNPPET